VGKSLKPIVVADIQRIFDDACIDRLAAIGPLPAGADRKRFAEGVREATRIYAREARAPNVNELRAEIAALHAAAERRRCGQVADLLEKLSAKASRLLIKRATRLGFELPASGDLRRPPQQTKACEAVLKLCQYGGRYVEGRRRSPGTPSRSTWRPLLVAPEPARHVLKRDAEQNFVMLLQVAWLEATGKPPSLTASATKPGPFVRMVAESLKLVGARHANGAELINRLNNRRKELN
jgi:hypothetical protein